MIIYLTSMLPRAISLIAPSAFALLALWRRTQ